MRDFPKDPSSLREYQKVLVPILREHPEGITFADLLVASGLAADWVEFTLRALMEDYSCRLKTHPDGTLIYIFEIPKAPRSLLSKKWAQWSQSAPLAFFGQTWSYIFGEKARRKDEREQEKIILNFLKHKQGKLVIAELVQLCGGSIYEAEVLATRLLSRYQGEVEVTDEGVIIYSFPDLSYQALPNSDIPESLKVWERPVPDKQMNSNAPQINSRLEKTYKQNLYLSAMATVVCSGLVLTGQWGWLGEFFLFMSGGMFGVSSMFFLIPTLRKRFIRKENDRIRLQNVERHVLKSIFKHAEDQIRPEKDLKRIIFDSNPQVKYQYLWNPRVHASSYSYWLTLTSSYHRESIMHKKALELEADISVNEQGDLVYTFDRLQREMSTISRIRRPLF